MRFLQKVTILFLLICLFGCGSQNKNASPFIHKEDFENIGKLSKDWHQYRVVAHALGATEERYDYTNTYEALVYSYNQGTRLFETDLNTTEEGEIVLLHEWQQYHDIFGLGVKQGWEAESTDSFLNTPIYDRYTPMTLNDMIKIMKIIPDLYLIIDSKTFDVESTIDIYSRLIEQVNDKKILKRIIPQAYSFEIYDALKEMDQFSDIIFTCYAIYDTSNGEEIYNFIKDRQIRSLVMHMDNNWAKKVIRDIRDYAKYSSEWNLNDFRIYIHTVNDIDVANSIINEEQFWGIYSDFIMENDYSQGSFKQ